MYLRKQTFRSSLWSVLLLLSSCSSENQPKQDSSDVAIGVDGDATTEVDDSGPPDSASDHGDGDLEPVVPQLDADFAVDGFVPPSSFVAPSGAMAVALDADQKVLVCGWQVGAAERSDIAVNRYNSNGTPDADFGDGGRVLVSFSTGSSDVEDGVAEGTHVVALARGGLLIGGRVRGPSFGVGHHIVVVRLDGDGAPEDSFAEAGRFLFDLNTVSQILGEVLVLPDDSSVIVGGARFESEWQTLVFRLTPSGAFDESFAEGGVFLGTETGTARAALLDEAGRIVVATTSLETHGGAESADFALLRLGLDGTLDTSFGVDGLALAGGTDWESPNDILLTDDGDLIALGASYPTDAPGGSTALARFDGNGELNAEFGSGGIAMIDVSPDDAGRALMEDVEGRILVVGHQWAGTGAETGTLAGYILRLSPAGALDPSFAVNGVMDVSFDPERTELNDALLDSNGRALVVGTVGSPTEQWVLVARYLL